MQLGSPAASESSKRFYGTRKVTWARRNHSSSLFPERNATGHIVHQRTYKFSIAQYPETRILAARPVSAAEISRRRRNNFPFLHVPRALIFNKTHRGAAASLHISSTSIPRGAYFSYSLCTLPGRSILLSQEHCETGTLVRRMKSREYRIKERPENSFVNEKKKSLVIATKIYIHIFTNYSLFIKISSGPTTRHNEP